VDLSGIIFVVLAVAWAVYLIPKALKSHDEKARTRSIDRFSTGTRVLARREPVNGRESRLVVNRPSLPPASSERVAPAEVASLVPVSPRRLEARRTAAKVAARRRRRILTFLLLCAVLTSAAAYLRYVPWWSVAVPSGLTLLFLLLCRTQVRHEIARDVAVLADAPDPVEEPVQPTAVPDGIAEDRPVERGDEHRADDVDQTEDTVGIPVAQLQDALDADADGQVEVAPAAAGSNLWDPLPVTLPTYVTKARAKRTVRTIDLGEPGAWTSGRTAEDAEIAARATGEQPSEGGPAAGGQRAVGS
jgi:hypothetical protein